MYASRGIGRQTGGDRRPNDRERIQDRSSYQNSPNDMNYRSDRDYEQRNKGYNDRQEYRNSPDNSYGPNSRDGFTPPGPPPTPKEHPLKNEPPPTPNSYAPTPSIAKPSQPNYNSKVDPKYGSNQSYETNRTPNYTPTPKYTPTPISTPISTPSYSQTSNPSFRPNPNPSQNHVSGSNAGPYGRDPYSDDAPTQKEIEERLWLQKIEILFQGVNSIEDLITLKEQYAQKTQNLSAILDKSNLREGEILRNKRRNRDDFKDPAMLELRKMQADIKRKLEEVNKFRVEIDKRIRSYQKLIRESMEKVVEETPEVVVEKSRNYESQLLQNSMITAEEDDEEEEEDQYEYENSTKEYFDPGGHWCRDCDKMVPKINDFFEHLHTKEHWSTSDTTDTKPWKKRKRPPLVDPSNPRLIRTKTAIKGVQFLLPLRGYYCPLCKEYLAENFMAEEHMKGAKHNRIYNRFICLNLDYERKWTSDKGKALSRHQINERKRKDEEERKELEKKKKQEDQKFKEEKELKKRKREEEIKRREKERDREERERERDDYKKGKSNHVSSSSDRFRLSHTMDLKGGSSSSYKDRGREREREKQKKRTRIYSSSDSSSSPPRKKKPTWTGDPYLDPKLKLKPIIKLNPLTKRTAQKFRCRELMKVLEEAKNKKDITVLIKVESKTEITIANSPLKMEIEIDDENDNNKDITNLVDGLVGNLDEDLKEDNPIKTEEKDEQKIIKDKNKCPESGDKSVESDKDNINSVTKDSDKCEDNKTYKSDKQKDDVPEDSFESEPNLEIDTDRKIEDNDSSNKELPKESDSNDKESGDKEIDSNDQNSN